MKNRQQALKIAAGILTLGLLVKLLLAADELNAAEKALVHKVEEAVAHALQQSHVEMFPLARRVAHKVHIGGDHPIIYKLSCTSGRPGKRIDIGYSMVRHQDKAERKFIARWKHELRANPLGKLENIPIDNIITGNVRLGNIRGRDGKIIGMLFLAATIGAFAVLLTVFTLMGSSPSFANRMEGWLNIVPAGPRPKMKYLFRTFVVGLTVLKSPSKHLALFLYSLPVWLLEGSMYFMLIYSFGIDDHFDSVGVLLLVALLLTATSNLATSLPSAIGGIGPFEIVAQQTLMALGVGASLAGAYSGFVHLVALWLPVNLAGLALLWKNNLSLRKMSAASRANSFESAQGLPGEPISEIQGEDD